eukprot:sb/3478141/
MMKLYVSILIQPFFHLIKTPRILPLLSLLHRINIILSTLDMKHKLNHASISTISHYIIFIIFPWRFVIAHHDGGALSLTYNRFTCLLIFFETGGGGQHRPEYK